MNPRLISRVGSALAGSCVSLPALAHHPMGGEVPNTLWYGLLSGLAHPVIGPDHLAFLLAAALLAAWSKVRGGQGLLLGLCFLVSSAASTLLRSPGVEILFVEAGVALTLFALAAMLIKKSNAVNAWMCGFVLLAGGLHGWAYGEAVLGAESTPLGAYVFALTVVQAGLLFVTYRLGRWSLSLAPLQISYARGVVAAFISLVGLLAMSGAIAG